MRFRKTHAMVLTANASVVIPHSADWIANGAPAGTCNLDPVVASTFLPLRSPD
jgi:hypothetical protein